MNAFVVNTSIEASQQEDGTWFGVSYVTIHTREDEVWETEQFSSDTVTAEDTSTLLEKCTKSLEKMVDLSNLLDDVDLEGGSEVSET